MVKSNVIVSKCSKLNLGCGKDIGEGYLNVDKFNFNGVDLVWDINTLPFPIKDDSFREILLYNILEHVEDVVKTMEEIYLISKKGAIIKIEVPHFSGLTAVTDPTHRNFFSSSSFDFFKKGKLNNYYDEISKVDFKIIEKKIIFSNNKILRLFNPLVNLNKRVYERFFAYLFPSQTLSLKLMVNK